MRRSTAASSAVADAERAAARRRARISSRCCARPTSRGARTRATTSRFVVYRNINFTNVCYVGCSFCGFSRHKDDADAYDHPMERAAREGARRRRARRDRALHPGRDPPEQGPHATTARSWSTLKREFPQLHIHAFSPEEIDFGHRKSGMPLADYLRWLVDAGLGTMPGTAAEILDDEIREVVSPRKLKRDRWVEIVKTAHAIGLRSTSTLMYGHIEQARHVAQHLGAAARDPEADGRLHRVRAARLHPRAQHALQPHGRAARLVDARGPAPGRGGAPVPAPVDHERAGVVGEDGPEARAARRCAPAPTTSAAR